MRKNKNPTVKSLSRAKRFEEAAVVVDLAHDTAAAPRIQELNNRVGRVAIVVGGSMSVAMGVWVMVVLAHTPGTYAAGSVPNWIGGAFLGAVGAILAGFVVAGCFTILSAAVRGVLRWRSSVWKSRVVPAKVTGGTELLDDARVLVECLSYPELEAFRQDILPVLDSLPSLGSMMEAVESYRNQEVPVPEDVKAAISTSLSAVSSMASSLRCEIDRVDAERAERVVRLKMLGMKEPSGSLDPEVFTRAAEITASMVAVRADTIARLDSSELSV